MVDPFPTWRLLLSHPQALLAFGFGAGLSRIVPGTAGTVVAVPFYLGMVLLPPVAYWAVTLAAFVVGIYLCGYSAKLLGVHDHGGIVWDEFVGLWVTMAFVPYDWRWLLIGFLLFRLFDMVKPWPIRWVDKRVSGGFGIMLDDVLAGLAAAAVLYWIVSWFG